jgi:hypothetical protein
MESKRSARPGLIQGEDPRRRYRTPPVRGVWATGYVKSQPNVPPDMAHLEEAIAREKTNLFEALVHSLRRPP